MNRYINLKDAVNIVRNTVAEGTLESTLELRLLDKSLTADVRENVQLDVCPLYGGACGYPSGECYDCPRHGNFRENVRGEWLPDMIYDGEDEWCFVECSNCKYRTDKHYNFCPNCGAEMRGEKNG